MSDDSTDDPETPDGSRTPISIEEVPPTYIRESTWVHCGQPGKRIDRTAFVRWSLRWAYRNSARRISRTAREAIDRAKLPWPRLPSYRRNGPHYHPSPEKLVTEMVKEERPTSRLDRASAWCRWRLESGRQWVCDRFEPILREEESR